MLKYCLKTLTGAATLSWLLIAGVVGLRAALPESDYLAYNVWLPSGQEIYLLDVEHGLAHSLTNNQPPVGPPVWSPDGLYLAFEGRYRGGSSIFILDLLGAGIHMLTLDQAGSQYTPVWFHEGQGLYFRNLPGVSTRLTRLSAHSRMG
jgi:Tol biopolymer transport system component